MGISHPRPPMRKREARVIEENLRMHATFMALLTSEGWERDAASKEALRMVREARKLKRKEGRT